MNETKTELKPDFCVIGAGAAGLSFASAAAQLGASVVLIEGSKMGGDCLNQGCVPSKALLAAAKIGHSLQHAKPFGWSVSQATLDFKRLQKHVQSIISTLAPHDSVERFEGLGVQVIQQHARFSNASTVETDAYRVCAKRFIVASGSHPFVPPIKGLDKVAYLTNENLFDLEELPEHLIIIGGGPIGIEMAQAFKRLGSRVTVLEALNILPKDDPDLVFKLKTELIAEGVEIHEQLTIDSVSLNAGEIRVHCNTGDVVGSHLLVATGRRASIENLGLEHAGIDSSPHGIAVNKYLRTSNKKVYAIGDCTGGYQLTHVAGYHAGLTIRNSLFRLFSPFKTQAIPWITYTDPELAHVGFLESQLKEKGVAYKVLEWPFEKNDRAQVELRAKGGVKVLVSPRGTVLGASILGPEAGELLLPWVMLIQNKLSIKTLVGTIVPYPTLSEISKSTASSFYAEKLFSPFMKRLVQFILRWTL